MSQTEQQTSSPGLAERELTRTKVFLEEAQKKVQYDRKVIIGLSVGLAILAILFLISNIAATACSYKQYKQENKKK